METGCLELHLSKRSVCGGVGVCVCIPPIKRFQQETEQIFVFAGKDADHAKELGKISD